MAWKKSAVNKDKGLPEALGFGLIAGAAVTLIGTGLLAYLVGNGTVEIKSITPFCVVIQLLASALTGVVSYGIMKRQRILVCGLSALCYFVLLIGMVSLVFDGQYQSVGAGALAVMGGGVLSILPGFIQRGSGGKKVKFKAFR